MLSCSAEPGILGKGWYRRPLMLTHRFFVPNPSSEAMAACPNYTWIHGVTIEQAAEAMGTLRADVSAAIDPSNRLNVHANHLPLVCVPSQPRKRRTADDLG